MANGQPSSELFRVFDLDTDADTKELVQGVNLRKAGAGGSVEIGTVATPIVVTGGGGGAEFNEDTAHTSGDLGSMALGVRRDADTSPVSADNDYHTLLFDALGNLKVNVKAQTGGSVATPADLAVTTTAAVGVGATLTLPAAGVGLFHFISRLQITANTAPVALAANAQAVVTSTNLPGSPAWDMAILRSGGGKDTEEMPRITPLRSAVANTATTIVAPATTNTIWRLNVEYFTG